MYNKTREYFNVTFDQIYSNICELYIYFSSKNIISKFNLNKKPKSKC